jgi:hypothetical protein
MLDASLSGSPGPPPSRRLDGWKEIAAHLGRGVRTVQRWEADLGMPVHRMVTGRGETVYAFAGELNKWRQTAEAKRGEQEPETATSPGNGPSSDAGPDGPQASGDRIPQPSTPVTLGTGAAAAATVSAFAPDWRRRAVFAAVAVGMVATMAWGGWTLVSRARTAGTARVLVTAAGRPQPAAWKVADDTLKIYDSENRLLWEYRFDFLLDEPLYEQMRRNNRDPVVMNDIDGDGNTEVLFVSEPTAPSSRGLFCFNRDGTPRFRHQPESRVAFGPLKCDPPWRAGFVRAIGDAGRPHDIWLVSFHLTEYPTIVEKLDARGIVQGEYWSDGQVTVIEEAEIRGRRLVLVGAANNESKGASLAALDVRQPTGTAPAMNPHYRCTGCPEAAPLAFLVFPRLEVARVVEDYAHVSLVRVDRGGQVMIEVAHGTAPMMPDDQAGPLSQSLYVLDSAFRVTKAELGARYATVHRMFEKKGLLNHPFSAERESRDLWPVLRWDGTRFVPINGPERTR